MSALSSERCRKRREYQKMMRTPMGGALADLEEWSGNPDDLEAIKDHFASVATIAMRKEAAARAMLAALKHAANFIADIQKQDGGPIAIPSRIRDAIAAAEAAGIREE